MRNARNPSDSIIVGVTRYASALHAHLFRIAQGSTWITTTISDALRHAPKLAARLHDIQSCVVIGDDVSTEDAHDLAFKLATANIFVVLAPKVAAAISHSTFDKKTHTHIIDSGAPLLNPYFQAFMARLHSLGNVEKLHVRSAAGKRTRRTNSTRKPFDQYGRIFASGIDTHWHRLSVLAKDAFTVVDQVRPGGTSQLQITELIVSPGRDRFVCHAWTGDMYIEVELDAELQSEGPLEIEAIMPRGSLICRLLENGSSLTQKTARLETHLLLKDVPSALEMGVLEALAYSPCSFDPHCPASTFELGLHQNSVLWCLHYYNNLVCNRPIELALVHVPRWRNASDELEDTSLATARLVTFARAHYFNTVAHHPQIPHDDDSIDAFTQDELVDAWLTGKPVPAISDALEKLWTSFGPHLLTSKEKDKRCLVGFFIADHFRHFQMNVATCLARLVKERTDFPTFVGGEQDLIDANRALDTPNTFDYVVDGYGEVPPLALLHLEAYRDRRPSDIPGVWSRNGNRPAKSHLPKAPTPT